MPNQPPLNSDALEAAARALLAMQQPEVSADYAWNVQFDDGREELRKEAAAAVSAYLAASLPEVTSVEELDQLPMHTYVQGADGFKHAKDWNGGWHLIVNRPSSAPHLSGSIELPARVLYRPSEQP